MDHTPSIGGTLPPRTGLGHANGASLLGAQMVELDHWQLIEEGWVAAYNRDQRWQVRVLEQCNNGTKHWDVRLFYDDDLRHTIETEIATSEEAHETMMDWVRYYHVIID